MLRVHLLAVVAVLAIGVAPASAAKAKRYSNCAKLNAVYPHGVGKKGARDKVSSGQRVTTFRVNPTVYRLNRARDRDGDGIACEKA